MADNYTVQLIPMKAIFSDPSFNCRGSIAPIDVLDLAKDIRERGLDQPIVLQPWSIPGKPDIKYRVVAGHRRHLAFRVNDATEIPAFVRPDLTELSARMLNLQENLHRKQLNIKQEAAALKFFLDYKNEGSQRCLFTEHELADVFKQSRGWIQVRRDLLNLPEDIQDEAAAGTLTQAQIRQIARIKDKKQQYDLVRKIKEAKQRGEKVTLTSSVTRPEDILKPSERDVHEIREMMGLIYDIIGPSLTTRFGAWAAGDIATTALYSDIERHCKENGIKFTMPAFVNQALLGTASKQPTPFVGKV